MIRLAMLRQCALTFIALNCLLMEMPLAHAQSEPQFGTRSVRTCGKVTTVPTPAQAAALVQCGQESKEMSQIYLLENVIVELGGPQPYNYQAHHLLTGVDTDSKVYPIRGSYRWYTCATARGYSSGRNCSYADHSNAKGYCWATTFGDWNCAMTGNGGAIVSDQLPPS